MASLSDGVPFWMTSTGYALLAISGAVLIAVRPADKAAQNEADVKRYQALSARADGMNDSELARAIEEAHNGDAPEIESLRAVAYNDMVLELNRPDQSMPLSPVQKLLKTFA